MGKRPEVNIVSVHSRQYFNKNMIEKILSQKTGALFMFTMLYAKSHELLEHG